MKMDHHLGTKYNAFHSIFIRSYLGFENLVKIFIQKGVNLSAVNEDGDSALILAALNGRHYDINNLMT